MNQIPIQSYRPILTPEQRFGIQQLKNRISTWLQSHTEQKADIQSITLFGSRATGTANPNFSDWDVYLIMHDVKPIRPSIVDDLRSHEKTPIEWHTTTVSRYLASLSYSSLALSRSVEKFGMPLYHGLPEGAKSSTSNGEFKLPIDVLIDSLIGIRLCAATVPDDVLQYLTNESMGFETFTKNSEPYEASMFLHSSELAQHVAKLVIAFRDITPHSIHQLDVLASQMAQDDPFRYQIAALIRCNAPGEHRDILDQLTVRRR